MEPLLNGIDSIKRYSGPFSSNEIKSSSRHSFENADPTSSHLDLTAGTTNEMLMSTDDTSYDSDVPPSREFYRRNSNNSAKLLPWAIKNVSSRYFPSDTEEVFERCKIPKNRNSQSTGAIEKIKSLEFYNSNSDNDSLTTPFSVFKTNDNIQPNYAILTNGGASDSLYSETNSVIDYEEKYYQGDQFLPQPITALPRFPSRNSRSNSIDGMHQFTKKNNTGSEPEYTVHRSVSIPLKNEDFIPQSLQGIPRTPVINSKTNSIDGTHHSSRKHRTNSDIDYTPNGHTTAPRMNDTYIPQSMNELPRFPSINSRSNSMEEGNQNVKLNRNEIEGDYTAQRSISIPRQINTSSSRQLPPPHSKSPNLKRNPSKLVLRRSWRRRIFLVLTEPHTSITSLLFFVVLIAAIFLSNLIMMMQTMSYFQYTPNDCDLCIEKMDIYGEFQAISNSSTQCICPPQPKEFIVTCEDYIIYFFTAEWILRVILFEPPSGLKKQTLTSHMYGLFFYVTEVSTILDALATFPYYLERLEGINELLSLKLLRLFRLFQLVRLGQYNATWVSLVNVMANSLMSLNVLLIVLLFGGCFFGGMIYGFERGQWKYTESIDPPGYAYVRVGLDGVTEEVSPFTSIPASFWWFIVTATTVGYGDVYPTTIGGKFIAALAMLTGVLVIAFPVSVFSDLWSKELKNYGALEDTKKEEKKSKDIGNDETYLVFNKYNKKLLESQENKENFIFTKTQPLQNGKLNQNTEKTISIHSNDLALIKQHLKKIDDSQAEIKRILKKL
mmetsp:Transcript_6432/g.9347  ORF Transcript_6432/g.9347 Transcript_6432/m.9347 type:complete len:778 (+) Transcript_6432:50-2383(+)